MLKVGICETLKMPSRSLCGCLVHSPSSIVYAKRSAEDPSEDPISLSITFNRSKMRPIFLNLPILR